MAFAPLSRIPKGAFKILHEIGRHLLRRPVVGIVVAARTEDGKWLLIRRADTGTWAMVGGTLEWGETLEQTVHRELEEEAGVLEAHIERVVGVFSKPERDPRFHAVTVVVECRVGNPKKPPMNGMEVLDVGIFAEKDVPPELAMGQSDMFALVLQKKEAVLE
jgi:8-oxo-dGTP diphosphatase